MRRCFDVTTTSPSSAGTRMNINFPSFVADSRYQAAKHEIIAWKEGECIESSDGGCDVKARVKQLVYMSIWRWMSLAVMVARPFGIAAR